MHEHPECLDEAYISLLEPCCRLLRSHGSSEHILLDNTRHALSDITIGEIAIRTRMLRDYDWKFPPFDDAHASALHALRKLESLRETLRGNRIKFGTAVASLTPSTIPGLLSTGASDNP